MVVCGDLNAGMQGKHAAVERAVVACEAGVVHLTTSSVFCLTGT